MNKDNIVIITEVLKDKSIDKDLLIIYLLNEKLKYLGYKGFYTFLEYFKGQDYEHTIS